MKQHCMDSYQRASRILSGVFHMLYERPLAGLVRIILLFLAISLFSAMAVPRNLAERMAVVVSFAQPLAQMPQLQIRGLGPIVYTVPLTSSDQYLVRWEISGQWVHDLKLLIPETAAANINHARIEYKGFDYRWNKKTFDEYWRPIASTQPKFLGFTPPSTVRKAKSNISYGYWMLNWPGDSIAAASVLLRPILLGVLVWSVLCLVAFRRSKAWQAFFAPILTRLEFKSTTQEKLFSKQEQQYWLMLLGGVVILFCLLQFKSAYYFLQDDNLAQFAPVMAEGCKSMFAGVFPNWNPHQFLGAPAADVGTYALTYPLTYMACGISEIFGSEASLIGIFTFIHLCIAAAGMFVFLRRTGVLPLLAILVALAYTFNGFFLISGRSWYYMLPIGAMTPWIMVCLEQILASSRKWQYAVIMGLIVGMAYHAGNVQMWVYMLLFSGIVFLMRLPLVSNRLHALGYAAGGMLLGVSIAVITLIPQLSFAKEIVRDVSVGRSMRLWDMLTLVFPWPLSPATPLFGTTGMAASVHVFYSSSFVGLAFMLGVVTLFFLRGRWQQKLPTMAYPVAGLLAMLFAAGPGYGLWDVLHKLPGFDGFRHPFKFALFIHLFMALCAAQVLMVLWEKYKDGVWQKRLKAGLLLFAALLVYHVEVSSASHYSYPPSTVLALKDGKDASALLNGMKRVYTIAPIRSQADGYYLAAGQNWATLFGIENTGGYDPLVEATKENLFWNGMMEAVPYDLLRAYGVDHVLVHDTAKRPAFSDNNNFWPLESLSPEMNRILNTVEDSPKDFVDKKIVPPLTIYAVQDRAPIVSDQDGKSLTYKVDWSGVTVDVNGYPIGTKVTIAYLYRPGMHALVDGREETLNYDDYGRITTVLTRPSEVLKVSYAPQWGKGLMAFAIMALLASALLWVVRVSELKKPIGEKHA